MTATVDFRRSDHEREGLPARRREESLCLSEFMDEILEADAGILDQANDFMHLLPGGDDIGQMGSLHLDPFAAFDEGNMEPVFAPLAENSCASEAVTVAAPIEDVVDVESVDSSEGPTAASGSANNIGSNISRGNDGCARTMGLMPHHYGKMKLRLRAGVEAASVRRRNRIISEDDNSGLLDKPALTRREGAASPSNSSPDKINSCDEQTSKSGRKSVRKRNRTRRISDTPPSSPTRWQGAHSSTPLVDISQPLGKSPTKLQGRADSTANSGSNESSHIGDTHNDKNNENSNSIGRCNRDGPKKKTGSQEIAPALSDYSNSSSACGKVSSLSPEATSKLRLDGQLVSPSRQIKPKQKIIPRSLVEKLKAAAQRATARQSILLPVPTPKPAENSLVVLDHDYCFQKTTAQLDRDNLEPEPMDVESDEEQGPVRIEVLPDLSLAKRQSNEEVRPTIVKPDQTVRTQEPVEVILRQNATRSLLRVNQQVPTVVQVVTLQQPDGAIEEAVLPEGTVMLPGCDQVVWTVDGGMAFISSMENEEQLVEFVEEEEVVTTTPSECGLSDSGVESLDRRRISSERDEVVDEIIEDGRESRRWRDERARSVKRSSRRDANNNNNNGSRNRSTSDKYRSRNRRRSGSATSNSSYSSSTDSGRSRSRSSEGRCRCASRGGRYRGSQSGRKRSSSRDACRRCRCPSPDYSVGSHADRQRTLEANAREAYTAAGWESRNHGGNTQRPFVHRRERKNIWCMDGPAQSAEPPQKRPQTLTAMQEALEKIRKGGDRKIIYVGKIPEGTTRVQIREWFSRFGKIAEVSLHFRDAGENYGFVTFERAEDAYRAVERGNSDPELPKFQLCFGGRRQFCGQQWSDLDSQYEKDYLREGREDLVKKEDDFDSLLKSLKSAPLSGARRR